MNKIESLIEKLNIQFDKKVPLEQLLVTVQMLQKEITGTIKEVEVLGTSSISVIAPSVINTFNLKEDNYSQNNVKEYFELIIDSNEDEENETSTSNNNIPSYEEMIQQTQNLQSGKNGKVQDELNLNSEDLPTLALQPKHTISKAAKQAPKVSRSSIKDLTKAINAQDRLIYIKELFRGDEIMFDRSIKTINNFKSLEVAEYWIERELRTNNVWLPANPVVQKFEQLIKKRFA